ncbi:MAG TPA: FMN-binding negative transcriptional regulator [Tepidisphaeraceae bacterium]|nr:FMN-binding negative transcriptional regulator [Tepidisphaeraceae bacterium]
MYIPVAFAEQRLDVLHDFLSSNAFATLVTHGGRGLVATHVPVVLLPARGPFGTLQFHLAKPNSQCDHLAAGTEALAIFQGPHAYISPTWYANQAAVPTWNYIAVHACGTAHVMNDEELVLHLDALVTTYEAGRPNGWDSGKLPGDVTERLRQAIIGFEMPIARIEGKWKLGQNRTAADRAGAIEGLRSTGTPGDAAIADRMAATVKSAKLEM